MQQNIKIKEVREYKVCKYTQLNNISNKLPNMSKVYSREFL